MHDGRTDHAVVIGAGMAGLLAARALADRFAQVTLVDRDATTGVTRPGPGAACHRASTHTRCWQAANALSRKCSPACPRSW